MFKKGVSLYLVAVLLIHLPAAAAEGQDDAGSGGDAPDHPKDALTLEPGTYNGRIGWWDDGSDDWYHVVPPAGQGVRIDIAAQDGYMNVEPCDLFVECSYGRVDVDSGSPATLRFEPEDGEVVFGVTWGKANYTFTISTFEMADLWVRDVRTSSQAVQVHDTDAPLKTQRKVSFRVGNNGLAASELATVEAFADQRGSERRIASVDIELEPGEQNPIEITWDTTGQVGDARIRVLVTSAFEADETDNEATTEAHVGVGGTGYGVDVFNHAVTTRIPFTTVDAEFEAYHHDGVPGARLWLSEYDSFWNERDTWVLAEARVPSNGNDWAARVCLVYHAFCIQG